MQLTRKEGRVISALLNLRGLAVVLIGRLAGYYCSA